MEYVAFFYYCHIIASFIVSSYFSTNEDPIQYGMLSSYRNVIN
jgi:hypothetical protein